MAASFCQCRLFLTIADDIARRCSAATEACADLIVDPQSIEAFDSASPGLVPDKLSDRAQEAADLLKTLAHTGRLMILCHLVAGPKSVGDLAERTQLPQATTSQLLTRLRHEGMVNTRREGKLIYYSLSDPRAANVIACVYETFC